MIDLTEWDWQTKAPEYKWLKVLMHHDELHYMEAIARKSKGFWLVAPGAHLWGPIVAWRHLREGEGP